MPELARSPIFLALVVLLVGAELIWRRRSGWGYDWPTAKTTLGLAAGNVVAGALNAIVLGAAFAALWAATPLRLPLDSAWTWIAGFVGVEFAYYWYHRASHRVRWLWATHSVHHSADQLTLLSSLRLGWTNLFSMGWVVYLPLIALGFDPRLVVGLLVLNLRYQFFLHTEAVGTLGALEWLLNTPAHHRAHHAANDCYIDRNFGGVLILFDRLFGTIARPSGEPMLYGLAHRAAEPNPVRLSLREWRMMFAEMKRTGSVRGAFRVALSPP